VRIIFFEFRTADQTASCADLIRASRRDVSRFSTLF
jgi:hypothetical protein